jgi:hypothetical protein
MSTKLQLLFGPTRGPRSILLVRLTVGLIFFTQRILNYIDPNMGVVRFTRIGFPHPYFTSHFVGTFEILCGLLLLVACRSEFVTADAAGGIRVVPLDRPSIGGVGVDVASEFASQVGNRGEDAATR